jgi:hypothetical protein
MTEWRVYLNGSEQSLDFLTKAELASKGRALRSAEVSNKKIENLKRTAQFRETAGETARHIYVGGTPPPHPMPLPEAQAIVRQIVLHWMYDLARED